MSTNNQEFSESKNKAESFFEKGYYRQALKEYEAILKQYDKTNITGKKSIIENEIIDCRIRKGVCNYRLKNYRDAKLCYDVKDDKKDFYVHNCLAYLYVTLNETYEANQEIKEAINKLKQTEKGLFDPEQKRRAATTYHTLGIIRFQQGLYDDAIQAFKKGLNIQPDNIHCKIGKANYYFLKGRYQKAINIIQDSLNYIDKQNTERKNQESHKYNLAEAELRYYLGYSQYALGNENYKDNFKKSIKKFKENYPSNSDDELIVIEMHNYIGLMYALLGEVDEAINQFERIINFYKNNKIQYDSHLVHAFRNLGIAKNSKNQDDAIDDFKIAFQIVYQSALNENDDSIDANKLKHQDFNIKKLDSNNLKSRGNVLLLVYTLNGLGVAYANLWKKDKEKKINFNSSIDCFEKATELFKNWTYGPYCSLGYLYDWKGDSGKAFEYYEKARKNCEAQYRFAPAYVGSGRINMELKKFEEAIDDFQDVITIVWGEHKRYSQKENKPFQFGDKDAYKDKDSLFEAYRCLSYIYSITAEGSISQFKKAIELLDEAEEIYHKITENETEKPFTSGQYLVSILTTKGHILTNKGFYEQAIVCFDSAIKYRNEHKHTIDFESSIGLTLANKGIALSFLKRFEEARVCFDQAFREDTSRNQIFGSRHHILNYKGLSLLQQNRYHEAFTFFSKAEEEKKRNFDGSKEEKKLFKYAIINRGYAINYSGEHYISQAFFNKILDIKREISNDPIDRHITSYALIGKGQALVEMERFDDAMDCFEQAMLIDTTINDQSFLNMGICKYKQKDYASALDYFNKIEINSYDNYFGINYTAKTLAAHKHNNIGLCYFNMGLHEDAKEEFRLAIKNDSSMADAYFNLGIIYNREKDKEKAKKLFESCKMVDRKHPEVNQAIEKVESVGKTYDWYQWWFGTSTFKKFLGMALSLVIVSLIFSTIDIYISTFIVGNFSITQNLAYYLQDLLNMFTFNNNASSISLYQSLEPSQLNLQSDKLVSDLRNVNIAETSLFVMMIPTALLLFVLLLPSLRTIKIGTMEIETSSIDMPNLDIKPGSSITITPVHMPLHFHAPISYDIRIL